jgi:hypothetical protein
MSKIEQGQLLEEDPRIGKRVLFLDESERRGYDVIGELEEITRFKNGDETWIASYEGWRCHASSTFYRIVEE